MGGDIIISSVTVFADNIAFFVGEAEGEKHRRPALVLYNPNGTAAVGVKVGLAVDEEHDDLAGAPLKLEQ